MWHFSFKQNTPESTKWKQFNLIDGNIRVSIVQSMKTAKINPRASKTKALIAFEVRSAFWAISLISDSISSRLLSMFSSVIFRNLTSFWLGLSSAYAITRGAWRFYHSAPCCFLDGAVTFFLTVDKSFWISRSCFFSSAFSFLRLVTSPILV